MRVLCTTHPGYGHLHPLVPLARALEAAGHEVAVATAASFSPAIEAAGLMALAAGPDWLQSESETAMPGFMSAEGPAQFLMLANLSTQGTVDDLLAIGRQWDPDVILRDATEYAGWVAAERLGIPHAAYGIGILIPPPIVRMWTGDTLSTLPTRYGLPADGALRRMYQHLYFNPVPETFELTPVDVVAALAKSFNAVDGLTIKRFARALFQAATGPKHLAVSHRLQPVAFDRSGPEGVPERLAELPAQPTIYATLGTVFNQQPRIFEAILAAFRGLPANLILTVGRNVDPARFGPQPANVLIERYIPQSEVLARCDAVITHGGYNTLIAALRHGLPVCCLPMAADQPINTRRAVRLGAGLSCANARRSSSPFPIVDPERLDPAEIRRAMHRLLSEASYRVASERLRAEIDALPGPESAVAALEGLTAATPRKVAA